MYNSPYSTFLSCPQNTLPIEHTSLCQMILGFMFLNDCKGIIIMGCGSSIGQVIDSKQGIFKLQHILVMNQQKQENIAKGRIFLFGQTRTHRKIIECEPKLHYIKTLSNKTRIPCPRISLDPLEAMYQESQEIFHLGIYGFSTPPPFNKMLALYLQANIIFVCGGRDYDRYNVKNQVFFYSLEDSHMADISQSSQLSSRTLYRPKHSRNKFQKMPSMGQKRYSHMGIYSNKVKSVLVFGGKDEKDQTLASCQIYSILENTWRDIPSMTLPRADGHCFEHGGKIYVFGGRSNSTKLSKKIEAYSFQKNCWNLLNFKIHRGIENALIFSKSPNQVLIVGGATHYSACKTAIKINLKEQSYVWDSQLNKEYKNPKGVMADHDIFLFGGERDSCEIFNNEKWITGVFAHRKNVQLDELQEMSFTRESLVVKSAEITLKQNQAATEDQSIFFGSDDYPCIVVCHKSTGKAKKMAVPLNLRLKSNMSVVQLPNKVFMLLGGSEKEQKRLSRSCFFYDANKGTAKQSTKLSEKKLNFGAVYYQNQVYLFGGFNTVQNVGYVNCCKFNLKEQKWIDIKRLNRPKYRVFAEVISEGKIAVLGQQELSSPVQQIQIYNTAKDHYQTFFLKKQIIGTIFMVFSQAQKNKIIILKEDSNLQISQIQINESQIRQQNHQKQADKAPQMKVVYQSPSAEKIPTLPSVEYMLHPSAKQSYQLLESQYQSSELHKNDMIAIKPKLIEIKAQQSEQHPQIRQQREDSSFQIQKITEQNNVMLEPQRSDKKLQLRDKKIQEQVNFDDDVYFSIDTRSLEDNFSTVKIEQNIIQPKPNLIQSKISDLLSEEKTSFQKNKEQPLERQFQGLTSQKYNIVKRRNQLYFFQNRAIVIFNMAQKEQVKHNIQNEGELNLQQIR